MSQLPISICSAGYDYTAVVLHHPHKVLLGVLAAAGRPSGTLRGGLLPRCIFADPHRVPPPFVSNE